MRFLLLFFLTLSASSFAVTCDSLLGQSLMPAPRAYPVPVLLKNLRISNELINEWAAKKLAVAVVGQHTKDFVSYLLSQGVFVYPVEDLKTKLPFNSKSIDVLIYDQVLSYQEPTHRISTILEAMRVLKHGACALIADFSAFIYHKEDMDLAKRLFAEIPEQSVTLINDANNRYPFRFLKLQRKKYDF